MMRSKFLINALFIATLFVPAAHAQSNFLSGYVINLKGDTVFGKIDYQNWDRNPSQINFHPDNSSENSTYFPNDIMEFKVMDEKYVSATVQVETSSRDIDRLSIGGVFQFKVQNVFLHTLFQGTKNLYAFQDKSSNDHFYYKEDTTYHLLLYKKYIDKSVEYNTFQEIKKLSGQQQLASRYYGQMLEAKRYVGQLLYYFSDCPSLTAQINRTEYTVSSMVNLYKKYYQSTTNHMSFEKKQDKNLVKFGVVAGFTRTTLDFSSDVFPEFVNAAYKPSYNLSPAISIEFIQNRNLHKWSLYNELLYTPYQMKGDAEDYLYYYHTEFKFHYLHLISMIRYTQPYKSFKPFINGGFSFGYLFAETNKMVSQSKIIADRTDYGLAIEKPRRIEFAYNIGMGIKHKSFTYEYRAMIGNGMSPYIDLKSDAVRNMILVGYTF